MDIVILGAIPHSTTAKANEAYIEKQAPVFARLLKTHQAHTEWLDIAQLGCTPFEYYQLRQAQYHSPSAHYAKGLGPLYCPADFTIKHPQQPIYLLELTHVEIGQHSAALYLASELNITKQQGLGFMQSVQEVLQDSPYSLLCHNSHTALLDLGEDFSADLLGPSLLATGYLNDWQYHHELPRDLRRLLSELQMLWFNSPLNQERQAQGQATINSACIYGGACFADFVQAPQTLLAKQSQLIIDCLYFSHLHQDWEHWLQQLQQLEHSLQTLPKGQHRFILCGFDRIVTLTPKPLWSKLFPQDWRQWWSQSK